MIADPTLLNRRRCVRRRALIARLVDGYDPSVLARVSSSVLAVFLSLTAPSAFAAEAPAVTEHDVLPIFLLRCNACHGATYQEGGLDLRSRASLLAACRT